MSSMNPKSCNVESADADMNNYVFSPPFDAWDLLLLRAIRIWPDDQEGQINYLRHAYRVGEAYVEGCIPEIFSVKELMSHWKDIRHFLGGREAINKLRAEDEIDAEVQSRTNQGLVSGLILLVAHQLVIVEKKEKLASWNKIVNLIAENPNCLIKFPKKWNKTAVAEAWNQYEPVAHFWAAQIYLDAGNTIAGATSRQVDPAVEVEEYLACANTFQKFGINHGTLRAKKKFLDKDCLYEFDFNRMAECSLGPFPPTLIDKLEKYRAPKIF